MKKIFVLLSFLSVHTHAQLAPSLLPGDQKIIEILHGGYSLGPLLGDISLSEIEHLDLVAPLDIQQKIKENPAQKRQILLQRYGFVLNPETQLPFAFTDLGNNKYRLNCLTCHSNNVLYPDGSSQFRVGLPNRDLDLKLFIDDRFTMMKKFRQHVDKKFLRSLGYGPFKKALKLQPLNFDVGLMNVWGFAALELGIRNKKMNFYKPLKVLKFLSGNPEVFNNQALDNDPIPWFNTKFRDRLWIDGYIPKEPKALISIATGLGNPVTEWEDDFQTIIDAFNDLEVPKYTGAIDIEKAAKGHAVFEQRCAKCHGHYFIDGSVDYRNVVVDIDKVQTDSARLDKGMTTEYRTFVSKSWLGEFGQSDIKIKPTGYVAPVLRGVWATAPYFHNGSVPTLYDVLHSQSRPAVWKSSTPRAYDFEKMGLKVESTSAELLNEKDPYEQRRIFNSAEFGKSKEGHTFPDSLSEEEKIEVLEYLKTL